MNLENCAYCGSPAEVDRIGVGIVTCSREGCPFWLNPFDPIVWNLIHSAIRIRQELEETFQPTPAMINRIPAAVRKYVMDLETREDPAGEVAALTLTMDQNAYLTKRIESIQGELDRLNAAFQEAERRGTEDVACGDWCGVLGTIRDAMKPKVDAEVHAGPIEYVEGEQ